ncbi:PrgI family mobile element protein [Terribacillus sp. JSM ZJ617]|uniref:PrgI family mobile element protein n=1 Tax=Terribacillus sp. JSM ZJ617 TaxID=3342119 RepID=UPI0035A99CF9
MSRKVTVPIDMASEQKTILGLLTQRQLIYIFGGIVLIYSYMEPVFSLAPNMIFGIIFCLISAVPTAALVFIFAFYKKRKYNLNFDFYLLIKAGYKKQLGIWRKGPK